MDEQISLVIPTTDEQAVEMLKLFVNPDAYAAIAELFRIRRVWGNSTERAYLNVVSDMLYLTKQ